MKKSLVALAVLAAAGAASAQSSVTLFGILDAGVSYYDAKNSVGVKNSQWALSSSGYNSSRLGFRGTEDLGGGLAASFWLEAPLQNDTGVVSADQGATTGGARYFHRRSTVSLSGGFGEIRLGRDYTPTFWNDTVFDPFGTNGVGTNIVSSAHSAVLAGFGLTDGKYVRADNSIGYFLPPNLGGFYGQLQYSLHENVKTSGVTNSPLTTGRYYGGRFGYANGPLDVALAYGRSDIADTLAAGSVRANTANLGASYDLGVVKLFAEISRVENDFPGTGGDVDLDGFLVGATAPIGAGLIRFAYSQVKADFAAGSDPRARKIALGYVHNLSKRTALYGTYAHISNKNGAAITTGGAPGFAVGGAARGANGFDLGIRHSF